MQSDKDGVLVSDGRLSPLTMAGWSIGQVTGASYVGITMLYLMFFLTEGLGLSPKAAGFALLGPRLWDMVAGPIMGVISDRTRSRFGRRRPYVALGAACLGVGFVAMFVVPQFQSGPGTVVSFVLAYLVVATAYSAFEVPYTAMAAEMTRGYDERTTLTGYRMFVARVTIVLTTLTAPALFSSGSTLGSGFALMSVVFGAVMILAGLISVAATAGAPQTSLQQRRFDLRAEGRALRENADLGTLAAAFLFQNLAIGVSATSTMYFLTSALGAKPTVAGAISAVGAFAAAVTTPLWVIVGRRLGKQHAYALCILLMVASGIPAFFLPAGLLAFMFALNIAHGIADAGTQLLPNAMVPDTVEADQQRTGQRREGAIFGAWSLCRKLGMALGALLAGIGLEYVGYRSGGLVQSSETITGVRMIFAFGPAVLWLVALVLMRRYRLSEQRFDEIKRAIAANEAAVSPTVHAKGK